MSMKFASNGFSCFGYETELLDCQYNVFTYCTEYDAAGVVCSSKYNTLVLINVSMRWDVPLSLCPGTKKFSCPGVPLSRAKGRREIPGMYLSSISPIDNFNVS